MDLDGAGVLQGPEGDATRTEPDAPDPRSGCRFDVPHRVPDGDGLAGAAPGIGEGCLEDVRRWFGILDVGPRS